jgi:GT2 family glycosyltransferase
MMNYPKVAVVILNYNGRLHLERFLPFVYNSSYPNLQLILGDNASTDDSIDFVRDNYPAMKVLKNEKNYGYAEGYNQVLKRVDADYFVLLNSDVEVTDRWLEPVIELMESDPLIAAAQPKVRSWAYRDLFEYAGAAGGFIDFLGYPFCRGRIFDTLEEDTGQYDDAIEVFWASGAALFIKKEYWDIVGGFDSHFFAHMEEIDLCWRLKHHGLKIMYCPDSLVFHVGGGTLEAIHPRKTYLNFRNSLTMLQKNLPRKRSAPAIFSRFWLDFIALLRFVALGKFKHARAINQAHVDFTKRLFQLKKVASTNTPPFNDTGLFKGSIVLEYFVRRKRTFKDLKDNLFS